MLWSLAAPAAERIVSFDADITVHGDATMTVVETITVVAEGKDIKRGIYRDFPTDYRDAYGNRYNVAFDVMSVRRNGYSESWFTEKLGNGVRLYIGERDRFVERGEHSYEITYRTNRQLGYFNRYDELYWNVTGNGWGFPIRSVTARVQLPSGINAADMSVEAYTGYFGAKGEDYYAEVTGDSSAYWETTRQLNSKEGLTIVVTWPKGMVYEPSAAERFGLLLRDNAGLLIAVCGLALMLSWLLWAWHTFGRDPDEGPVFPHYEPPERLSPGACRYVMNMAHDNQCVTAAVLSLAVKGYITIHQGAEEAIKAAGGATTIADAVGELSPMQRKLLGPLISMAQGRIDAAYKDTYVLKKNELTGDDAQLGPGEKALLKKLFADGDYLLLTNKNHKGVAAAIKAHKKSLKRFYQAGHFLTNTGMLLPAIVIAIVTGAMLIAVGQISLSVVAVVGLAPVMLILFATLLKAPTPLGRKVMDQVEGFKQYLAVAEPDEIASLTGLAGPMPAQTPELYERYMPFALAFDMEQPWAEQFEQMFMRIATEQGQSYRPRWYSGNRPIHSFSDFSTDLAGSFSSAISSSSTPPGSSSGSGGGGFSGGGGGGGGGGGW